MFSKIRTKESMKNYWDSISRLTEAMEDADAVLIGAGSGLSASAGFTYSGERFETHFSDFRKKYGIQDMYSGGFYPYDTLEEYWAWWSRHIYWNRYVDIPGDTYKKLLELVKEKDYFVLTTNVDHCFQKTGFDKKRLFYTQGDYGLFQCSRPCCQETYGNESAVRTMIEQQKDMRIPAELIPRCPHCGAPMNMNLRCDETFVQDEGWYRANSRYSDFIRRHEGLKILYLELAVGGNTPSIIKYPFWRMTAQNPQATYVCVNYGEAFAPGEIRKQSICVEGDCDKVITDLLNTR